MTEPQIIHSRGWGAARHWLTIKSEPPLQVGPVASNHCRIGVEILRAIYDALERLEPGEPVPETVDIDSLPRGRVLIDLPLAPARWTQVGVRPPNDDDETQFLTPMPHGDWSGSYDEWIFDVAARLDLEPNPATGEDGYQREMASANEDLRARLHSLRMRFLGGLDGLELLLKFPLATSEGGTEWCWALATSWDEPDVVVATLDSEPFDCPGFEMGQEVSIQVGDLRDYSIGSSAAGMVESGPTDRIAADYGLVL